MKVSVVIPTYNRANLLARAIRSVQKQTFEDYEIIVVDDASEDDIRGTVSACESSEIRYLRHSSNQGGSAARNTGIRAALGEYIAFLDSDDEWRPLKLKRQVQCLDAANDRVGLVYTGMVHIHDSGERTEIPPRKRGNLTRDLLLRNVVGSSSVVLARKSVFRCVGKFDTDLTSRQDLDMWLRISKCYDIEYVDSCDALIHKDRDRNRISLNNWGRCKGYIKFYKKHEKLINEKNKSHVYLYKMGRTFDLKSDKIMVAAMCYTKSIEHNPFYIYPYVFLLKIIVNFLIRKVFNKTSTDVKAI